MPSVVAILWLCFWIILKCNFQPVQKAIYLKYHPLSVAGHFRLEALEIQSCCSPTEAKMP
jgi:hypothetical protein